MQTDVQLLSLGCWRDNLLYCWQQLGFTQAFLPEPMLIITQDSVLVKMLHNIAVDNIFEQLTCDGGERYWSVIWWLVSPFLKMGTTRACIQSSGISPRSMEEPRQELVHQQHFSECMLEFCWDLWPCVSSGSWAIYGCLPVYFNVLHCRDVTLSCIRDAGETWTAHSICWLWLWCHFWEI